jgi:hypothetical protein
VLPLGPVDRGRPQDVQRSGQPLEQRAGIQQPGSGGRQLDRQRQALQASADLHHRRGVGLGQGKVRTHRAGPVHEQRHRRGGRQLLYRHNGGDGGERQRRHRIFPLGPQPQHRTAGGQDRHAGTAAQQFTEVAGDLDHLL